MQVALLAVARFDERAAVLAEALVASKVAELREALLGVRLRATCQSL